MAKKKGEKKAGRPGPGRRFKKGQPGGPGRPKGVPNKITGDFRKWGAEVLSTEKWRGRLLHFANEEPSVLTWFYDQVYGRARQTVGEQGESILDMLERFSLEETDKRYPTPAGEKSETKKPEGGGV